MSTGPLLYLHDGLIVVLMSGLPPTKVRTAQVRRLCFLRETLQQSKSTAGITPINSSQPRWLAERISLEMRYLSRQRCIQS